MIEVNQLRVKSIYLLKRSGSSSWQFASLVVKFQKIFYWYIFLKFPIINSPINITMILIDGVSTVKNKLWAWATRNACLATVLAC